jgi:hypothetical protein
MPHLTQSRLYVATAVLAALAPSWKVARVTESETESRYRLAICAIGLADTLLTLLEQPAEEPLAKLPMAQGIHRPGGTSS